jgi:plasmid stability protein
MKATIEIPDVLYRRVKARAALDGRAVRDVTIELYTQWVGTEEALVPRPAESAASSGASASGGEWLARWLALGDEMMERTVDTRLASDIVIGERR